MQNVSAQSLQFFQCAHSILSPSLPPLQVKRHTCQPTSRGYVRPTSLTQNWPRSLPDNMQALLRHSTEYLWSRQHSKYMNAVCFKLETVLSRDCLACLAPPDMFFSCKVSLLHHFSSLSLCASVHLYTRICTLSSNSFYILVFSISPSPFSQTRHFRASGNAECCRRP